MIRFVIVIFTSFLMFKAEAAPYPDPERWASEMYGFNLEDEIIGPSSNGIVATGSSSMRFWDHRIHEDLAPLTIISRGFGGSNMNDVLHHIDTLILKHNPRAVMIYEGDNDVADGVPVKTILSTYEKVIDKIQAHRADTRIYLLSVKPSIARADMWPAMQAVNAGMQSISHDDKQVFYIDVAMPMFDANGELPKHLFVNDMLHMNQTGYDIWKATVAPILLKHESQYE